MKKIFFCVSLALAGLMSSCVEKYEEVDAESKPEWLGSSIYAELSSPSAAGGLQGTFNTYLRLISDLGQADVLSRTGSKTVFPANDEAFARFFAGKNDWDVHKYEDLSYAQKVLLLKSSMLDNPLLLQLLPNVSNGGVEPMLGQALKHETNVQIIDTVQVVTPADLPKNNTKWAEFASTGLNVVADNSRPRMVHLTREFMLNNNITFTGENSDFALITGKSYPTTGNTAYIFNERVIVPDVTCQNGYIHQMDNVIVPPGNLAQVLRKKDNTTLMSRLVDYYAIPVFDTHAEKTTEDYNAWAEREGKPRKEAIYHWRYLSKRSATGSEEKDINTEGAGYTAFNGVSAGTNTLTFDPGWNGYYPKMQGMSNTDISIMDMGTIFAPSDKAMQDYFLKGGNGAFLIDIYGKYKYEENTAEHLAENLDYLYNANPGAITAFVNNLMKSSFTANVPSKFPTILDDTSENMGLTTDVLQRKADGTCDITIANNGALYVLNKLIAPGEYSAVLAPSTFYPDMQIMKWAVQDRGSSDYHLGVDFRFYLMAMKANYAFFIPEDDAFSLYYLDPTSLGHTSNGQASGKTRPEVLKFYYLDNKIQPYLKCERYALDPTTGSLGELIDANVAIANVKTQLVDILNYHTVVLPSIEDNTGDSFVPIGYNGNHYYLTKHGGALFVDGNAVGSRVMAGPQVVTDDPAKIKIVYNQKNGHAYRLDRVIQPVTESVYSVLKNTVQNSESVFSEFLAVCQGFDASEVLTWAGISDKKVLGRTEQEGYMVFTNIYKEGDKEIKEACVDLNVKMFNTFNYTLFAPDNKAMQIAYSRGLPSWDDISKLYVKHHDTDDLSDAEIAELKRQEPSDQAKAKSMIKALRDFVRYHFMTNSVFADNELIQTGKQNTLSSDALGVAKVLTLSGGNGVINLTDRTGQVVATVSDSEKDSKVVNKMTRDYWYNKSKLEASAITTSSFCAVHQISAPLCGETSGRFDENVEK
ncbi:MAG: hypothetical protein IJV34_08315 [Prevotella sp.]|nr:hypothetical protein [Prevotella sp.]